MIGAKNRTLAKVFTAVAMWVPLASFAYRAFQELDRFHSYAETIQWLIRVAPSAFRWVPALFLGAGDVMPQLLATLALLAAAVYASGVPVILVLGTFFWGIPPTTALGRRLLILGGYMHEPYINRLQPNLELFSMRTGATLTARKQDVSAPLSSAPQTVPSATFQPLKDPTVFDRLTTNSFLLDKSLRYAVPRFSSLLATENPDVQKVIDELYKYQELAVPVRTDHKPSNSADVPRDRERR